MWGAGHQPRVFSEGVEVKEGMALDKKPQDSEGRLGSLPRADSSLSKPSLASGSHPLPPVGIFPLGWKGESR